jgi:hypothetical protein
VQGYAKIIFTTMRLKSLTYYLGYLSTRVTKGYRIRKKSNEEAVRKSKRSLKEKECLMDASIFLDGVCGRQKK